MTRFVIFVLPAALLAGTTVLAAEGMPRQNAPAAAFDWSMPQRYGLDRDADGVIDPFEHAADISPPTWRVDFDACTSTGPELRYRWSIDGEFVEEIAVCDGFAHEFPGEGSYTVSLEVADAQSNSATASHTVVVQDWLIIGMGDSYACGEGNPDIPILDTAVGDFERASAALDAAQQAASEAGRDLETAISSLDGIATQAQAVRNRLAVVERRAEEEEDACGRFPPLGCPAATLRLAEAVADLLFALAELDLQELIDRRGDIEDALRDQVNAATSTADAAQALLAVAEASVSDARDDLEAILGSFEPTWQDKRCHRSAFSGQSLAALEIEAADPRTSVTFVPLSCSGGRITKGLLEEDEGQEPPTGSAPLPPQLEQAAVLAGSREIDAVFLTIGGNDLGFSGVIESCIIHDPCHQPPTTIDASVATAAEGICAPLLLGPNSDDCLEYFDDLQQTSSSAKDLFDSRIVQLPGLYDRLADGFQRVLPRLPRARVYLIEYPNPLRDEQLQPCAFDPGDPLSTLPGLRTSEALWAEGTFATELNRAIAAASDRHGWTFVGGPGSLFERSTAHGYCAAEPWTVRLQESFRRQGDALGTLHPNRRGHDAYAEVIVGAVGPDLYRGGHLDAPRLPQAVWCPGDCDASGEVTVDEILAAVGIALGNRPIDTCLDADANGDGEVSVDEILQAVSAALAGC
jgi:hypothetical protein